MMPPKEWSVRLRLLAGTLAAVDAIAMLDRATAANLLILNWVS
jgi:hypothetical protein